MLSDAGGWTSRLRSAGAGSQRREVAGRAVPQHDFATGSLTMSAPESGTCITVNESKVPDADNAHAGEGSRGPSWYGRFCLALPYLRRRVRRS
jgi:hypothetical protein